MDLPHGQWHEQDPDDDRRRDDRPRPGQTDLVELGEHPREQVLERLEDAGDDHASALPARRLDARGRT